MKKTKAMLHKEFNKLQKDYLQAIRTGNLEKAEVIAKERFQVQQQLRRLDESYVKRK